MKKRMLCLLLILCMLIPMIAVPVSAANPNASYVYKAGKNLQPTWRRDDPIDDSDSSVRVTPLDRNTGAEKLSYEVPRDGAVVMVFFWTGCGVSQMFFESLADSPWIRDERVKFMAIASHDADNAAATEQFRQEYAGSYMDQVEWYHSGKYTMFHYFKQAAYGGMAHSNTVYYPLIVVITEEEYTESDGTTDLRNVLRFAEMATSSATALNNTLNWLYGVGESQKVTLPADQEWNVQVAGERNYDMASQVVALVNEERAKEGRDSLEMNKTLTAAAMQRAAECALYYSHDRPYYQIKDIPGLSDRLASCTTIFEEYDYTIRYEGGTNADSMGENIAAGQTSAAQVMTSWMNSYGHRQNILSENHTQMGVGCFTSNGITYWVQLFSSNPAESDPISPSGKETAVATVKTNTEFLDFDMSSNLSLTPGGSRELKIINRNTRYSAGSCFLIPAEATNAINEEGTVIANVAKTADNLGFTITSTGATGTGTTKVKVAAEQTDPFSLTVSVTAAHEHSFSEWKVQTAATCKAEGTERRYCLCGEKEYRTIPAGGHAEEVIPGKAATCKETGLTEGKKCSTCGEIMVAQQELPLADHTPVVYSPHKDATCTQTGNTVGTMCNICGAVIQRPETIPKTDHIEEVIPGKQATCTETGLTEGKKCTVCGKVTVKQQQTPKAHNEEVIPAKAATCTETGLTEGKKCATCGTVTLQQQTIPKIDHTEEVLPAKAATCTETGLTEGKKCSVCGEILVQQRTVAKTDHNHETIPGRVPTCAETGLTEGIKCADCGLVILEQQVLDRYAHRIADIPAREATCTKAGCTAGKGCSECGMITEGCEEIPMLPHTEEAIPGKAATCQETGLTEGKKCSICGTVTLQQEALPITDHAWGSGVVVQPATSTQAGLKKFTCTVCGTAKEQIIPVQTTCDGGESCPLHQFNDVTKDHWGHQYIDYAINNGLMKGTEDGFTFSPDMAMSRAMLVTVLWRYCGSPEAPACDFRDVQSTDWFYAPVAWAAANGVVAGGGDGTFNPNGNVTREQLALILFRFAALKGVDNTARADLSGYPDTANISDWAEDAMEWAVAEGIISGAMDPYGRITLDPQNSANRAVVATIMMRFIQNVIN